MAATPDEVCRALAMREAGYTTLSISQAIGISVRQLQRYFAEHGTKKGTIKPELIEAARVELIKRVTSDDAIRAEAAQLINDDLAQSRHLREVIYAASEHLRATNLTEATYVMRAAAAYSTAIKNTSDTLRKVMQLDKPMELSQDEIPELVISELTQQAVVEMRNAQDNEDDAPILELSDDEGIVDET